MNCKNCNLEFEITKEDEAFYEQLKIPCPTLCPDCRQQRRLTWRNERTLYKRKCDATGKDIVSVFSPGKPFTVYNNEYWHGENWSGLDFAQEFDFNRPFFPQFEELLKKVPQLARSATGNYNSDFINQAGWNKNCYLIFEADHDENCLYSVNIYESKVCLDLFSATKCELCYDCLNCQNCYNLKFSQNCQNCSDSAFLKDCIGCQKCFGCVNIRNKQFYFLNEKCTKEEYEQKLQNSPLKTQIQITSAKKNFQEFIKKFPHKYINGVQNEDSTGDYLWFTQRCKNCFNIDHGQDCKFVFDSRHVKKVYDMTVFGSQKGAEFCCDNHEIGEGVRNIFYSDQIWNGCYDIYYSKLCSNNCHHLFGCIGLKHQNYCLLNKKYSEDKYETMKTKIIEHMKKTGEWGEFFPTTMSPFAYNETMAQVYFPLTKEAAVQKGYKWKDPDPREYLPQKITLPETIAETDESILNEILACTNCQKNYKIVKAELDFYRRHALPIPSKCFECRHSERFQLRNSRKLFKRTCQKCGANIETAFPPDHPEIIYCETCYQQSLI